MLLLRVDIKFSIYILKQFKCMRLVINMWIRNLNYQPFTQMNDLKHPHLKFFFYYMDWGILSGFKNIA